MKKYAAIYLGTRWTPDHPWGVLVEHDGDSPRLLCVGCTEEWAKELSGILNRQQHKMRPVKMVPALAVLTAVLISGCTVAPLKGGKATTLTKPAQGIEQTVVQGDNPAQPSRQDQEIVRTKTYTVPAGSRLEDARVTANDAGAMVTNLQAVVVSAPMPVVEHEETRAKTELGAAQKDTARELSAKLASLKGIVWVGVVMFLFGLASIFYPPLQAIIGSVTTSAAILVGGIALMILPTLIVGNELLILAGVAAAVGVWFFAHRHGQLRGLVDAVKADLATPPDNSGKAGGV
jgi:hypothetical protein